MWVVACVLLLFSALIFSLQFKSVQTYFAKKAASYLSKELKTTVNVKSLYIKPFKSVVLEGLYIQDLEKDTLLYTPRLTVDLNSFSLKNRKISVNTAQLDNGKFYLKQYKDTTTNLEFIINYFDTGTTKPKTKPRKPYDITFDKIVFNNIAFKYKNFNHTEKINGINFNDIDLRSLNGIIANLDTKNHLVKADFSNLSFREKSGFYLKNLQTTATIDTNQMEFKNLLLETNDTHLEDYLLMKYENFKDFNHFVDRVSMKVHFKDARLHSKDVAYFAPALSKMDLDLRLDGNASGFVNNIRARNLAVQAGNATYLKGNFSVKGLPKTQNLFMDLDFDQIQTNKKDLDYIIAKATGNKKVLIPTIVNKFGTVYFKGRLTGSVNDLISYGEFKTALGRVKTDVNLKIINKNPVYSGKVTAYDFNLGKLIDQKDIGRTTFTANLKGSGTNVNRLRETIQSDVTYFDFKGYRYSNININGSFIDKLFDGRIKINDRNIKLDFAGNVNLNPKLPVFNFTSSIRGANLHKLKLVKDTVQIDADFTTNFTGSNLDNIQGSLAIRKARLTNNENSFVVDSLTLAASGLGNSRSLEINSDILDARITGQYDLNTLPSYFKSVIKKYAPSIQMAMVNPRPQNFDFTLRLKQFEPISLLFIPELKIPEGANFTGKFVSEQNIANLNGFAKLIEFGKIKINNLIIDETTGDAMNLFITSDRVDLTDSLYVKNINIANILNNDSLNLNVKLSDKDAINQLDLNGLVNFNSKNFADLSILPSDVVINRDAWKIQEKVKVSYDKGKIGIENFELFRDDQLLTVNGMISADPDDILDIGFNNFNLKTFSTLTQSAGITLEGELNGEVQVAAITKTRKIDAELKLDSLVYNKTRIGELSLNANYDNETRLVNVNMDIINNGKKTLDVEGTYNANSEKNSLDLDVVMRDNELIIFEPFLKKLVSNMNGQVSADLKISGVVTNPKIDGQLHLKDAGMTVNYLKTAYKITDDLEVNNSVIKLDQLELRDVRNNKAIATGTVDMGNPNNPTINVSIDAHNFMALNTTEKDNPLYFGTAYGTGSFNFNGPTDNMKININAKTEPGTVFNVPLNSAETVSDHDFITFVAKDSAMTPEKTTSFNGLTMTFNLLVDQNTEVNIITDLGKLTGRGDANLALNISSLGDFEMFGDYLIESGKFVFTSQDFINKIFDISQGGSIRWTGNPTEALINLTAVYVVRTDPTPLYTAAGRTSNSATRVLSQASMKLTGSLLQPNIGFDLDFPNDPAIKDELQAYLSDVNNKNQQALSLIVRRSFTTNSGFVLNDVNSTVYSAGTELIFNQFNNYIAQALNLNTVDLNIRSLNDASASVRLFNDRLILSGGVTDRRANIQDIDILGSNIARDVEAQYLIKKDGSLIAKASNRLNNRNFLDQNTDYISAIGLIYRQEFDTFGELLRKFIGKRRQEERAPENQPKLPPTASVQAEDKKTKSQK